MRPAGKARRPRILGIFEGGATPPDGMQRRPNAKRFLRHCTSLGSDPELLLFRGPGPRLLAPSGASKDSHPAWVEPTAGWVSFCSLDLELRAQKGAGSSNIGSH